MSGKLKTTGNARKPVSSSPKSIKVPGLPGLAGEHEAKGISRKGTRKMPGGSINGKKGMEAAY